LQLINNNTTRLLSFVDQLLELAKFDRDEALKLEVISLKPIVVGLVAAFQPIASTKSIFIKLNGDWNAMDVVAEKDAVEIVLSNLLSNAIKYCPAGSAIDLSSYIAQDVVIVRINDDGHGIADDEAEHIFERFYRGKDSSNAVVGTGLGLSVARNIAQRNHGDLRLLGSTDEGAAFEFSLPLASANSPYRQSVTSDAGRFALPVKSAVVSAREVKVERVTASVEQSKAQLLIIEDDQGMRGFIERCLSDFSCQTAATGEEGVELALQLIPDLIICDVMMPGMNGFDVSRMIRGDARTSHIPIILLTARVDQESRLRGWNENIDDYLNKPFEPTDLQARITSLLAVRSILQQRYGRIVGTPLLSAEDQEEAARLPEREAKFLKKLDASIAKNYSDSEFHAEHLASTVAMRSRKNAKRRQGGKPSRR